MAPPPSATCSKTPPSPAFPSFYSPQRFRESISAALLAWASPPSSSSPSTRSPSPTRSPRFLAGAKTATQSNLYPPNQPSDPISSTHLSQGPSPYVREPTQKTDQ